MLHSRQILFLHAAGGSGGGMVGGEWSELGKWAKRGQKNQKRDFPGGPIIKTSPSNTEGIGSIPGWGAKISHASRPKRATLKTVRYCNKFNKDFKN